MHGLGYPTSFTHQAHAHFIMSNSSSVASFRAFSTSGPPPSEHAEHVFPIEGGGEQVTPEDHLLPDAAGDHVVVIHPVWKDVKTGAASPQVSDNLPALIDTWITAWGRREALETALRPARRTLGSMEREAAAEAAPDPLRRRSVIRCRVATSLLVGTGATAGAVAGALLNSELLLGISFAVGLVTPVFIWRGECQDSDLPRRIAYRKERIERAERSLQKNMKTVATCQGVLINSRRALMVEKVTQVTDLPKELADIVVSYRVSHVYLKQGRAPAVDSKSHPAALPSAAEGGGVSAEGRAQQRQRLLDEVPSADRNFPSLSETRDELRSKAIDMGHPRGEVEAWLADEATTIELLSKVNSWTQQLAAPEWTESLACYCASHFGSYDDIPEALRSRSSVKAAMTAFADTLMQDLAPCAPRQPAADGGCFGLAGGGGSGD